ncbi:hypothetical protein GSI_00205 [Ganoderma sinense ZZ0214-1]|uniref:N-acetyltransferase domain-containing protein n=1 Tax=Ganoderma sinense ZZ0214-1 TaxID=1077348 RepID=A0A2G8SRW9_9APHY|nr:hypothetical protein GSI_00205 [Ganoderma sinense ZZ0214-1]
MAIIKARNEQAPLLAGGRRHRVLIRYVATKDVEKGKAAEVEPLRYSEVSRAARESFNAIDSDSLYRYFRDGDHTPFFSIREKFQMRATFSDAVHRRKIFTVGHGSAVCYYGVPGDKERRLTSWVKKAVRLTQPAELSKRKNEFSETAQRLAQSTFGEQMLDMIEIRGLAVSTKRQGRGYGTALVEAIHAIADEQGRAIWLVTGDAVGFYETLGYIMIREHWIGTGNPAWNGPPVPVRIVYEDIINHPLQMVRGPQPTVNDRRNVPRH